MRTPCFRPPLSVLGISNMMLRRAARVILVGAPGVGKGTQTERMLQRYPQLSSISSGDLLRENVRNETPLGKEAAAVMKRGELVPDSMILNLIRDSLVARGWLIPEASDTYTHSDKPSASFVLDGFPRTAAQANQLDALIPVNLAIHIHTPQDIILDRICNRWIHPPSGRTYNTTFNPPKNAGFDDVTGEKLVQRDDDKPEVWKARLQQFEKTAVPLLEHYDKQGVLWKVEGGSSDEISPQIFEYFEQRWI
jgi:adenylate kinase